MTNRARAWTCLKRRLAVLAALVVCAFTLVGAAPDSTAPVCNEGLCVAEEFRSFYETNNGRFFLGPPETGATLKGDTLIQYFLKGRLELNLISGHIRKGDVGLDLVRHRIPFAPGPLPDDSTAHLYFPETGYTISFAFKDYYLANEGFREFGPPISPEYDEGLSWTPRVQYFTKARLEYYPENIGTSSLVQIGNVGRELTRKSLRGSVQPPLSPLRFGIQAHTWFAPQHRAVVRFVADTGFGWVKHLILWSEVEPVEGEYDWVEFDAFVEAAEFHNLRVLVTLVDSPAWSRSEDGPGRPDDMSKFQRFMADVAERYKGRIAAYEIWNEPNLARFWGRQVDPKEYVRLLQQGYRGVKQSDPNALVLFAGLAQNGAGDPTLGVDDVEFLRAAYKYENGVVRESFDAMGNHSYGYRSPPHAEYDRWFGDEFGPFRSHPSFFFKRFTQIRAVMEEFDDGVKPMWMTEVGWTADNLHPDFQYGGLITGHEQARYLVDALELVEEDFPYVHAMFVFNLNFRTLDLPYTSEHGFSLLDAGFVPRLAYNALKELDKSKISPARRWR